MPLARGTRLGPYEVVDVVGSGGMGVVYRARDTRLGRPVALKVLPPEFSSEPDRKARFLRISGASLAENHPHDILITQEAPNYTSDLTTPET